MPEQWELDDARGVIRQREARIAELLAEMQKLHEVCGRLRTEIDQGRDRLAKLLPGVGCFGGLSLAELVERAMVNYDHGAEIATREQERRDAAFFLGLRRQFEEMIAKEEGWRISK